MWKCKAQTLQWKNDIVISESENSWDVKFQRCFKLSSSNKDESEISDKLGERS